MVVVYRTKMVKTVSLSIHMALTVHVVIAIHMHIDRHVFKDEVTYQHREMNAHHAACAYRH